VYIQRLACYVQHKEDPPSPPFDRANGISNPYKSEPNGYAVAKKGKGYLPQLSSLDNENAIIIFENSQSGSFEDCLIPARSEWETHWRRLPFYLAYEAREVVGNDDLLGRQYARMILDDVFRALAARWEILLDACQTHVSILEDKIYEQPADETRAPELWRNSSLWLQLEKLTTSHMAVVRDMRVRLRELVADINTTTIAGSSSNPSNDVVSLVNEDDWLEEIPREFDRVASTVEEALVKPTQALISLLYQSVSIRDSRLSLQIDTSMWRLSWVTFIFLPLTFMVGFFGMNVDTFSNDPSLKWYFIVTVPFMLSVLGGWYVMKHILLRQRQTPYRRGIYESFFHDLAVSYPALWSRVGPRDYIIPRTRIDRWKWWLIKRWSRPERTIKAGQPNADTAVPDDLSRWSKCKRYLIRRWTDDLTTFQGRTDQELWDLDDETDLEQGNVIAEGLLGATEMLTVPGQPVASVALEKLERQKLEQQQQEQQGNVSIAAAAAAAAEGSVRFINPNIRIERTLSPPGRRAASSSPRGRRPASSGAASSGSRNSSVLVEEEDPSWISQCAKEGKGWYWRPGSQSPAGRSGGVGVGAEGKRRTSSGGSGNRPAAGVGFRRSIDERVGGVGSGGSGGGANSSAEMPTAISKGSSPLGVMTSAPGPRKTGPAEQQDGEDTTGSTGEDSLKSDSSGNEAERAAEETAGRDNERVGKVKGGEMNQDEGKGEEEEEEEEKRERDKDKDKENQQQQG
jgi:CorA-like Mg2+ transporter protein